MADQPHAELDEDLELALRLHRELNAVPRRQRTQARAQATSAALRTLSKKHTRQDSSSESSSGADDAEERSSQQRKRRPSGAAPSGERRARRLHRLLPLHAGAGRAMARLLVLLQGQCLALRSMLRYAVRIIAACRRQPWKLAAGLHGSLVATAGCTWISSAGFSRALSGASRCVAFFRPLAYCSRIPYPCRQRLWQQAEAAARRGRRQRLPQAL